MEKHEEEIIKRMIEVLTKGLEEGLVREFGSETYPTLCETKRLIKIELKDGTRITSWVFDKGTS